jgi:hypothetical protein
MSQKACPAETISKTARGTIHPWLKQKERHHSFLYALCNARRYYINYTSPQPGDKEWEALIDAARYKHKNITNYSVLAKMLKITLKRITNELTPPAILTVINPCIGTYLHSCLFVGKQNNKTDNQLYLVGYRTAGPIEEVVSYSQIAWPGPPNDWHWLARLQR